MTTQKHIKFVIGGVGAQWDVAKLLMGALLFQTRAFREAQAIFDCTTYVRPAPDVPVTISSLPQAEGQFIDPAINANTPLFHHMISLSNALRGCAVVPVRQPLNCIWARNERAVTKPPHVPGEIKPYDVAVLLGQSFEAIDPWSASERKLAQIYREDVPTKTIFLGCKESDRLTALAEVVGGVYHPVDFDSIDAVRDVGICLGRLLMENTETFPTLLLRQGPVFTTDEGIALYRACVQAFTPKVSVPRQPA